MTDMRRITVALPERLDNQILELRKDERFLRCSYSEIVRQAMEHGIDLLQTESASPGQSGAGMQDSA